MPNRFLSDTQVIFSVCTLLYLFDTRFLCLEYCTAYEPEREQNYTHLTYRKPVGISSFLNNEFLFNFLCLSWLYSTT